MVPAGTAGSIRARVSREPKVREPGERLKHEREHDHGHERLQHDDRQQQHNRQQRDVCEPQCAGRRDRGSSTIIRQRAAGFEGCGSGEAGTV